MKKILFAAAVLISLNSFATDEPVTKEVLKAFNNVFPNAKNVKWSVGTNQYEAYFKEAAMVTRIRYDKDGNILMTIRSYDGSKLPLLIQTRLKKAYPDKKIFSVTEVSSNDELKYEISMEDSKTWTFVHSDSNGMFQVNRKFKKA
jgi:hypothetical protein